MNALSLEQLAPRVISGGHKRVVLTPPATTTIVPYKGCFVRYRIKSGGTPTLDTIRLLNNTVWSYYEPVSGDGNYNNRPFGIIVNRPAESDDVKDPNKGKWVVLVFDTEDAPIRVAFRMLGEFNTLEPVTKNMLGLPFTIYGKQVQTAEGTFILPFAKEGGGGALVCRQVYPATLRETNDPAEYGWVVLDLNYAQEVAQAQSNKFLSFPYVIPHV